MSKGDIEYGSDDSYLSNDRTAAYTWTGCTVTIKDRKTGADKRILDNVAGVARAGELLALMGPSGSGKTTLLNLLARRTAGKRVNTDGQLRVDGVEVDVKTFRSTSSYVEQEDALIGSLTVKETLDFAARMAPTSIGSAHARKRLVGSLLASFGLNNVSDTIIGTPIKKGISGGQKRRVSVASQLLTAPKILFLDEPTSGLDATASREVISFIRDIARKFRLTVICSIHQPSTTTFNLFDTLCLLSEGKTCYFGPVSAVTPYFTSQGFAMPAQTNPAEYLLDLVNNDFAQAPSAVSEHDLRAIHASWKDSQEARVLLYDIGKEGNLASPAFSTMSPSHQHAKTSQFSMLFALLHRAFIKSYRDPIAYWVRVVMYLGLAFLMGTVWLRLDADQTSIQPFVNSIFFGAAFLSFMQVAFVPSFLEDYSVYTKDRANGLYGPTLFSLQNFLIGVPYLFLITILFSVVSYWLTGFENTGRAFFTWVMWVFLDLLAAESLVVLLSSIVPIFVVALALIAFANGLWMAVGGFLVPLPLLNSFYRYVFHYIDYQAYVFQGMMVNEFKNRVYSCGEGCHCSLPTQGMKCKIPGESVLETYGYGTEQEGQWVGILISIIVVYRLLGWGVLWMKRA